MPRHREINDFLARRICRDLEIPAPALETTQGNWLLVWAYDAMPTTGAPWSSFSTQIPRLR